MLKCGFLVVAIVLIWAPSKVDAFGLFSFWKTSKNCECPDGLKVRLGTVCSDGGICAGTFNAEKYMITPGGCNDSATPTCPGTIDVTEKTAFGSGGSQANIAGAEDISGAATPSTVLGDVNTTAITNDPASGTDHAASFCENMTFAGHSDWYLPSKSELVFLFCNSNNSVNKTLTKPFSAPNCGGAYGATSSLKNFADGAYWSSTEDTGTLTWAHRMNSSRGDETVFVKGSGLFVRCIRRY